jgi:hypothetical protein
MTPILSRNGASGKFGAIQNSAPSKQTQGTFSQKKRGIYVGKNSELEKVVEVWDKLPAVVQAKIISFIEDESLE